MYIFPYDDQYLIDLINSDPSKYEEIVSLILTAGTDPVREMYEINLYNGWF